MDYLNLIKKLQEAQYLKTPLILEAFRHIDRADFVSEVLKEDVGFDAPLPIGFDQTISQPFTVAFMLELLQPMTGEKILDVGSGSGWTSALLAYCVSQKGKAPRQARGKVFAVERVPELCEFGKNNIAKYNFIERGIVKIVCGDGTLGLPSEAPFDKILASASAKEIPSAWKKQLKIGGRLVLPIENSIWLIEKKSKNKFKQTEFPGFVFVPLIS